MIRLGVTVVNANEVRINLDKRDRDLVKRVENGLGRALIKLQTYIKENLLSGQVLHNRSGNLRRSILVEHEGLRGRVYIGDEGWYGRLHELGVHHSWVVEARNKQALHFEIGGVGVFAKRVTIPGLPERSFLRRGLREQKEMIVQTLREAAHG